MNVFIVNGVKALLIHKLICALLATTPGFRNTQALVSNYASSSFSLSFISWFEAIPNLKF